MTINFVLYLFCFLSLIITSIQMLGDFFTYKNLKKYWLVISSSVFYCFLLLFSSYISIPSVYFLLIIIFIYIISLAFSGSYKKKLLVSFVITVINVTSNIIAYMLITPGKINFLNHPFIGTILIIQICERIIKKIFKDDNTIQPIPNHGMILIIVPFCSLGIIYISEINIINKYFTSLIAVFVLIVNVTIFYLYRILEENYYKKIRNCELEKQIKNYSNELKIITESQRKFRSLQHDIHHHMIELEGLVNFHKWEEIKSYLNNMKKALENQDEYVDSGNLEVDSLLNYFLQKANDKLQKVDVKVIIPEDIEINAFKFNVIIGNLIENAIQASEESEDKLLFIEIKVDKGVLFITIINSYKMVTKKGNTFISTKSDRNSHGLGLENVKTIVAETHGNMDISIENGLFTVNVLLYIDELR